MGNGNSKQQWLTEKCDQLFGVNEVCLPQDDDQRHERSKRVQCARHKYNWRFDGVDSASMINGLPVPEELPQLGWLQGLLEVLWKAIRNRHAAANSESTTTLAAGSDSRQVLCDLNVSARKLMTSVITCNVKEEDVEDALLAAVQASRKLSHNTSPSDSFDAYRELYRCVDPDIVVEDDQFLTDEIFAWYRVAGANCMRLTKCTDHSKLFPTLTDTHFRDITGFEDDTLAVAASSDRLYYVAYPEFENMKDAKPGRYVYAPSALFAVPQRSSPRRCLLPIAIRCKPGLPMFTPRSDKLAWIAAKNCVQVTDAVMQSVVYHLARTHLVIEVFNCATRRSLADNHPLYKLLMPHFYGTALMNWAASKTLVVDGYDVDSITSPAMSELRALAARSINSRNMFSFNQWMPDIELEHRGVMSDKLHFPYRDDALLVWDAVLQWAQAYVSAYYKSDADVVADTELEQWCEEVSKAKYGNLPGFGDGGCGRILSVDSLIRSVAMIIFTASAGHAATNFPQGTVMQFAPAMPLGGYAKPLEHEKPYSTMQEMVSDVMPPLEAAETQMFVAEVLGTYRFTLLGQYGSALQFVCPEIKKALKKFQVNLEEISVVIGQRNQAEREANLPPYDYLNPKNVPQSINI